MITLDSFLLQALPLQGAAKTNPESSCLRPDNQQVAIRLSREKGFNQPLVERAQDDMGFRVLLSGRQTNVEHNFGRRIVNILRLKQPGRGFLENDIIGGDLKTVGKQVHGLTIFAALFEDLNQNFSGWQVPGI